MTPAIQLPSIVAHADWSMHPAKRWMAVARLLPDGGYALHAPTRMDDTADLVARLREQAEGGAALIGFDFPIGLPHAYAERRNVGSLREFLATLRHAGTDPFFMVARRPEDICLDRPFYPQSCKHKGAARQAHLTSRLGLTMHELCRSCDRPSNGRHACAMFWTLGANQVGKGAITGWREVILPASQLDHVSLWPFDGRLAELLSPGRVVLAETYPADVYPRFGLLTGARSKCNVANLATESAALARAADCIGAVIGADLRALMVTGFAPQPSCDDRFDAVVGLLGMIDVLRGRPEAGSCADRLLAIEGWMLGRAD